MNLERIESLSVLQVNQVESHAEVEVECHFETKVAHGFFTGDLLLNLRVKLIDWLPVDERVLHFGLLPCEVHLAMDIKVSNLSQSKVTGETWHVLRDERV